MATKNKTGTKKDTVGGFNFGSNAKPKEPRTKTGVRVWPGQPYGS